jgi:hypothetical protein
MLAVVIFLCCNCSTVSKVFISALPLPLTILAHLIYTRPVQKYLNLARENKILYLGGYNT